MFVSFSNRTRAIRHSTAHTTQMQTHRSHRRKTENKTKQRKQQQQNCFRYEKCRNGAYVWLEAIRASSTPFVDVGNSVNIVYSIESNACQSHCSLARSAIHFPFSFAHFITLNCLYLILTAECY